MGMSMGENFYLWNRWTDFLCLKFYRIVLTYSCAMFWSFSHGRKNVALKLLPIRPHGCTYGRQPLSLKPLDWFFLFRVFNPRPLRPKGYCCHLHLCVCLSVPIILVNMITQSVNPINPPNLLGGFNMALSWMVLKMSHIGQNFQARKSHN